LFYFMSHLVPFPLVLPPIFYKTKPLLPHDCPLHVPKMPNGGHVMHLGAQYVNQAQKPPLIMFTC
jgi:hypothetical protein